MSSDSDISLETAVIVPGSLDMDDYEELFQDQNFTALLHGAGLLENATAEQKRVSA